MYGYMLGVVLLCFVMGVLSLASIHVRWVHLIGAPASWISEAMCEICIPIS
jgi:hypothetical protein